MILAHLFLAHSLDLVGVVILYVVVGRAILRERRRRRTLSS
jgi:hypothetical protein